LAIGFGFAFTWFYLLAGFGVDYFQHRGLDRAAASFAFGLIGGISIVSRLASGAIADRIGYGRTYLSSLGSAVIGCGLLLLPESVSLYLAIVFFGISLGGVTTLYVPITLRIYDPDKSTAVIGIFSIWLGIAAIAAPPLATTLVGSTGSFLPVIILTMVTVFVAILLVWLGTHSHGEVY
jgi:MFS family permease